MKTAANSTTVKPNLPASARNSLSALRDAGARFWKIAIRWTKNTWGIKATNAPNATDIAPLLSITISASSVPTAATSS
ncbi:MAG: hypothetical protein HLUCCO06_05705 [Halomonas sp. HL-93]|nr:MAG: hypothetical protein HLUCCO06_05705 [Halomonas sp. HL-93]